MKMIESRPEASKAIGRPGTTIVALDKLSIRGESRIIDKTYALLSELVDVEWDRETYWTPDEEEEEEEDLVEMRRVADHQPRGLAFLGLDPPPGIWPELVLLLHRGVLSCRLCC